MATFRLLVSATIAAMCTLSVPAQAQTYPNKPIRLIVPFPPGGSTDIIGRIVGQKLGERVGQSVLIDNRGGAGGTLGADLAAKASADGYTLVIGTTSTHAVAAGAYAKLPYDPVKDFAPITLVGVTPYLLVVNRNVEAKTLAEFVALAKAQPGKLNYGSAGNGTTTHLAMEMLRDAAGLDIVHIPYKGNGPAEAAVLNGEVQTVFGSMPALLPQTKAGQLKALAVGTARRSPALPDVPTVAEQGYPGFEAALWLGVYAPAGTPQPVIDKLATELRSIVGSPDYRELLDKNGAEPISNTPAEFAALTAKEVARYVKVVNAIGLKLE